jgi:RND family efflux transporter MFP subunit
LIAQQEIDDAQSKDLVSEAQISAARSNLASVEQQVEVNRADLKRVRTMFDYSRVTAPFTGVVTRRFADTGSMIQAGTASQTQAMPVVRLSENTLLRLILPVPESAVPTVHIGQQVDVHVPTLGRAFPGKVARFADRLSLATRTMDTEVDVPNPKFVLVPGMYAEVTLTLAQRRSVLTVPIAAVDITEAHGGAANSGNVMVITASNRVEPRTIEVGLETPTRVEVLSGLNEGDMVVIGNRRSLPAGVEVRPKVTELMAAEVER